MNCGLYEYTVMPQEVDFTKHTTIIALSNYILHTAGIDADKRGFGITSLNEHNWTWVLSRMAIEIERLPIEHEPITIQTWISDINRLMTTRNFVIRDAKNNIISKASTLWAMIDIKSRLPQDLRNNKDYVKAITNMDIDVIKASKIGHVNGEIIAHHTVSYSDIDFNQHANSTKYLQWMIDTIPLTKFSERTPYIVEVNFNHETLYGQKINIFATNSFDTDTFEIMHDNGTSACKACINWK